MWWGNQSNLFSQLKDTQDPMSQDTVLYSANYALCIIEFGSGQLILMFILYTITILRLFYSITMSAHLMFILECVTSIKINNSTLTTILTIVNFN